MNLNINKLTQMYVGKEVVVCNIDNPNYNRSGIITDILDHNISLQNGQFSQKGNCVVLWENDENITLDKNGKLVYNMFDPVSIIPLEEIDNEKEYEIWE